MQISCLIRSKISKNFLLFLSVLLIISCKDNSTDTGSVSLEDWSYYHEKSDTWYPATVPGNIFLDLWKADIIEYPYQSDYANQLLWVGETDWEYKCRFDCQKKYAHYLLEFEGLDTKADIYVNGSLIGTCNNMFRAYSFSVTKYLRKGENVLRVSFRAPVDEMRRRDKTDSLNLPYMHAYLRKAPFQSGWDWAPDLPGVGIWQPVHLHSYDVWLVKDAWVHCEKLVGDTAYMVLHTDISAHEARTIRMSLIGPKGAEFVKKNIQVDTGLHRYSESFKISQARLWYPNGMGKQEMYSAQVKLASKEGDTYYDSVSFAVREVHLVQQEDSAGEAFYFEVNGSPCFMKGANYVPSDCFLREAGKAQILQSAADAHFNMIRVWGGGVYESDRFYALCDSLGIMVWQDFMFACAVYPGDAEILRNLREEVTYQATRLQRHPSLALFCGNNEVKNAWMDWGWQETYGWPAEDSTAIWEANKSLFNDSIPLWLEQEGVDRDYISTSPMYGWGHPESNTHGDSHYWGVWWGEEAFESYFTHTGRFMSEFGFQAYPDIRTVHAMIDPAASLSVDAQIQSHQRHPFGKALIANYLSRYLHVPDTLPEFVYYTQVLQAYGVGRAIRNFRSSRPYCMGSLYWQLNDCWPAISWSSLDYNAYPKALHYEAKRAYAPQMLFAEMKDGHIIVHLVNDALQEFSSQLEMTRMNFKGEVLGEMSRKVHVEANAAMHENVSQSELLPADSTSEYLYIRLLHEDSLLAEYCHYYCKPKHLNLPEADIELRPVEKQGEYGLLLSSDVLVKDLALLTHQGGLQFSDNYFDLLPGREVFVFTGEQRPDMEAIDLHYLNP